MGEKELIDTIISALGYSGTDNVVTYIVVMTACILIVCLAYRLFDFIFSLISSVCGRGKDIKF